LNITIKNFSIISEIIQQVCKSNDRSDDTAQTQNAIIEIDINQPNTQNDLLLDEQEQQLVITPLKENYPFRNLLTQDKSPESIRIYLKNINGIKTYNSWTTWQESCQTLNHLSVDIFGNTETNINWNEKIRNEARIKCQQHFKSALINTSSSIELTKTSYQPGGTSTVIVNKYTGRATKPIIDYSGMGRWSGYQLQGNNNQTVNIITAYRPVVTSGIHTCYQQHLTTLNNRGTPNPDPRQQMLDDLTEMITNFNSQNNKTILMMDANENLFANNSKLPIFLAQSNLTSLIQPHNHPATHSRGSHCIDYIFGSPSLLEHVIQSGITPFYEQPWPLTDHRGLFVDIHYLGLFGASTPTLMPKLPKRITSLSKTMISNFIKKLEQTNQINQLLTTLNDLSLNNNWTDNEHKILETIDVQFTNLLLSAEAEIAIIPVQYPWSPELHQTSLIYTYWIIHLKGNKNNIDIGQQLNEIQ
jgi:hypothetical protein